MLKYTYELPHLLTHYSATPPAPAKDRTRIEQRAELTHIALQIESGEEVAIDVGSVWKALCNQLNGRGLEDLRDNTELSH